MKQNNNRGMIFALLIGFTLPVMGCSALDCCPVVDTDAFDASAEPMAVMAPKPAVSFINARLFIGIPFLIFILLSKLPDISTQYTGCLLLSTKRESLAFSFVTNTKRVTKIIVSGNYHGKQTGKQSERG